MDARPIAILLAVGSFPVLEAGFRSVLGTEPDMRICEGAVTPATLAAIVAATGADVVVTECVPFTADRCSTAPSIEAIRAACPATKIVAFECRCGGESFSTALKAGADAFLTREATPTDVVAAIRSVTSGNTYVSPAIVTRMVDTYLRRAPGAVVDDPWETLSDRERQVILLASVGHTNREIAARLELSEQTVHNHRANAMQKLGLHDRVELLRYSVRRGLVSPADL